MASIPNTRPAPAPAPTGKTGAPAVDGADFALQIAAAPEGFLPPPALTADGAGTGAAHEPAEASAKALEAGDPLVDAAQLAALIPVPPVAAPVAPTIERAPATGPVDPAAVTTTAGTAATAAAAIVVTTKPIAADTATDIAPAKAAPLAVAGAIAAEPKTKSAKPAAEGANAADSEDAPEATDVAAPEPKAASAKEVIAAARKAIETALHATLPRPAEAGRAPTVPAAIAHSLSSPAPAPAPADVAHPVAGADPADAIRAMSAAPPTAEMAAAPPKEAPAVAATPDRTLDMGHDDAWLDRLARDIAQAAGNDGAIRFRLNPQTLGHLHVELSQGDRGTTVRMTTETEQARAILADAQPRLAAEARAQGVRIAESHVDLSGSGRQPSGDPRRQDDARQTPLIRTARGPSADAPASGRATATRSDRFA